MNDKKCSHCNKEMPSMQGGIITEIEDKQVHLCGACWNKFVSKEMGIDFKTIELKPITLTDCSGNQHTFHFFTHIVPSGLAIEAHEIVDGERTGYRFEVLGPHDCNQQDLILDLYEKIKRGLGLKYLEHGELGKQIKDMSVVGRIEWDDEYGGEIPEAAKKKTPPPPKIGKSLFPLKDIS